VVFHGFKSDVAPLLARADVFILSSISEGIPLTLLEAMATGLPGIATDVGGNREVVVPGTTGYLVPPGTPEAIAEAVLALRADRATLERMGIASRARVESGFNLRAVVAEYEDLYRQCLAGALRPPSARAETGE
jgi:glycosyltransferase involved in cell wall biosynthesis